MISFLSILLASFISLQPINATATDCEVELAPLKGTYEGGCKKGKAHGEGIAVGEDTYKGTFRKGLPHGTGKYTWANGNVYEGEWAKGEMHGEGSLYVKAEDSVLKGHWIEGEYIGTEKDAYKVLNKSVTINRMTFSRQKSEPFEIDFNLTYLGKPIKFQRFSIQDSFGVVTRQTDYTKTVTVYEFPVKGTITFETNLRNSGNQIGEVYFQINQSGQWSTTIEVREL